MIGATSPTPASLEEAIHECVIRQDKPFTTDDVLPDILDRMAAPPSDAWTAVDDALLESEWIFYDEETDMFIPRQLFFKGAQFLITPQSEEIEANILIPGHRFVPFLARDVFPGTCQLLIDENAPIPCRVLQKPIQDILIYLSFYGRHGAIQYLTTDQESNNDVLDGDLDNNPEFAITIFDMADIYARHAFKKGDAFLCTVKDWARGIYDMQYVPGDPNTIEFRMQEWIEAMDSAIYEAWEAGDYFDDIYAELSEALFMGPESLCKNPPLHFGGFLARSEKVSINQTPLGVLLVHADYAAESLFDRASNAAPDATTGRCESIDAILNDLGLSTTQDEIEAYMRDAYARGERTLDAPTSRAFAGRESFPFYDENQLLRFGQLIDDLWDEVCGSFNSKRDKRIAPYRARILDMLDKHTAWLRDCDRRDVPASALPEDATMALASMTAMFSELLGLLNRDEDTSQSEITQLEDTLNVTEQQFNLFLAALEEATSAPSTPKLRVLSDLPVASATVYQLKVTLKGIRPPIWRRLLVRGDATLEHLHATIQVAMGWQNCHLHDFQIDGLRYAPASDDDWLDFEESEHESEVMLHEIAEEGDKFLYTYDYGDGWEHTIQVEKVLPEDEDTPTTRCIKGRRACPPEDCGGPHGYEHLLNILSDPNHPDHAHMSEWAPSDFDPDKLDIPSINAQLKRI